MERYPRVKKKIQYYDSRLGLENGDSIMVELLEHKIYLYSRIREHKQIIGIDGKGIGVHRRGNKDFIVQDIKKVIFEIGEEKEAIKLFVDTNREILLSHRKFRSRLNFYPHSLYKYFIGYLYGEDIDNVPAMDKYQLTKSKIMPRGKFCQYIRDRCPELLEDSQSLLHNCKFLNKISTNHQKRD